MIQSNHATTVHLHSSQALFCSCRLKNVFEDSWLINKVNHVVLEGTRTLQDKYAAKQPMISEVKELSSWALLAHRIVKTQRMLQTLIYLKGLTVTVYSFGDHHFVEVSNSKR